MRDVLILSSPVAEPGVCGKCGSQDKEWFVDLGFDMEMNTADVVPNSNIVERTHLESMWLDGVLYLCCDCLNNTITDIARRWEDYSRFRNIEVDYCARGIIDQASDRTESDNPATEPDNSSPVSADSGPSFSGTFFPTSI